MSKFISSSYRRTTKIKWGIAMVVALLVASIVIIVPTHVNRGVDAINSTVALGLPRIPERPFSLGLDLRGGAQLLYQADTSDIDLGDRAEAVEGVRDVIEQRVNGLGVAEPSIVTNKVGEEYRVLVELPGITDIQQAIAMIGATPILEFREEREEAARSLTPEEEKQIAEDNLRAKQLAERIAKDLEAGRITFDKAVEFYSQDAASATKDGYVGAVAPDEVHPDIYSWLAKAKSNEVRQGFIEIPGEGYYFVKRGGEEDGEVRVTASHILICYVGARNCDSPLYTKEEALERARQLLLEATPKNFAQLAKQYSTDPSAKENNGDLGTFPRGVMIPAFEDAIFQAPVGVITGPVESEFGYHLMYKRAEGPVKKYELFQAVIPLKDAADILPPSEPFMPTGLSGAQLERAEVVTDQQTGAIQVSLQFDAEGKQLFRDITEKNLGKPVAIYLDGNIISAPTVQQVIRDGQAVISGSFTLPEARILAQRLNAGALPVPVELISQQQVGATLGAESLARSLRAGVLGFLLVMIFMIVYYRIPGVLAVIALGLYTLFNLALFKVIGVTLTLSGIAGFILSVGMAVDANVLIFERMKEELQEGKSLKAAIEEGFVRAWSSIRDGNVSTLFACLFLIWFGSSFVQGFALTLTIGILISMFTAITISRLLLRVIVPWFPSEGNRGFLGFKKPTI